MERTNVVRIALIFALALWSNGPAHAAQITILVNQGALSGVRDLAAGFEKASGHKVVIDFVGVPEQAEKINTDAPGDVVVNFMPAFEDLIKRNKVVGSVVEFARAGNGVAVKAGAPKPDISTPEAFKRALLAAVEEMDPVQAHAVRGRARAKSRVGLDVGLHAGHQAKASSCAWGAQREPQKRSEERGLANGSSQPAHGRIHQPRGPISLRRNTKRLSGCTSRMTRQRA